MKTEAENKINKILSEVWGIELVVPILEEEIVEID